MRLKEFATPDAQLELWKMVSDAVWSAINKQNSQHTDGSSQSSVAASRAQDAKMSTKPAAPKSKAPAKKGTAVKLPKIPVPPPKPRKPLNAKSRAKPKQTGMTRAQAPAEPITQRQQAPQMMKPAGTAAQPLIAKTPNFDAKTGVFPQNRRVPVATLRKG